MFSFSFDGSEFCVERLLSNFVFVRISRKNLNFDKILSSTWDEQRASDKITSTEQMRNRILPETKYRPTLLSSQDTKARNFKNNPSLCNLTSKPQLFRNTFRNLLPFCLIMSTESVESIDNRFSKWWYILTLSNVKLVRNYGLVKISNNMITSYNAIGQCAE